MQRSVLGALMIFLAAITCAAQEAPSPPSGVVLKEETSPEVSAILDRLVGLRDQGRTEEAFKILDDALLNYKDKTYDRYALLTLKFDWLSGSSKHQEALGVAIEKANIVTSPRQALNVAQVYIRVNDHAHALEWIVASVDRGLQSYAVLESDTYKPLRDDPRFRSLIETVEKRNGLGLPAKPFLGITISGQEVSLDMYKGKVLLLDFWATWCGPCRAEMPNLIRCYHEFKDKGFEIVGFAEDKNDEALKEFLRKHGITWPIVPRDSDHYDAAVLSYAIKNIPASFLIDKTGVLRHVNLTGDSLRNAIGRLVKE
jgi:thiol-disulfide isomerase/thioredoxin